LTISNPGSKAVSSNVSSSGSTIRFLEVMGFFFKDGVYTHELAPMSPPHNSAAFFLSMPYRGLSQFDHFRIPKTHVHFSHGKMT
jgi:hypothetical protein